MKTRNIVQELFQEIEPDKTRAAGGTVASLLASIDARETKESARPSKADIDIGRACFLSRRMRDSALSKAGKAEAEAALHEALDRIAALKSQKDG